VVEYNLVRFNIKLHTNSNEQRPAYIQLLITKGICAVTLLNTLASEYVLLRSMQTA